MGDIPGLTFLKERPKKINPLKQVFLLFILFALVLPISAQETEDIDAANSTHPVLIENQNPSYSQEDILRETQRSVDRSISILNVVATSMGVLVGLITLIIIVAIAFGFFELKRWRTIREDIEKRAEESKNKLERVEKDTEITKYYLLKNAEEDVGKLGEEIKNHIPPLTEEPSKEIKEKLDEFSRKLEFLEMLGAPLKEEDYFNRGVDLYYKGKYELALMAFEKAIEIKPDFVEAWYNKGVALGELGRYEEALTAIEKAIEIKPDDAGAWNNKGTALGELGRYEEALTAIEKAIEIKPDLAEAWNNKGTALGRLERYEEALTTIEKAIEIKPDYAGAWDNKGVALLKIDHYDEALKACEKAIELEPDYANAWFNKACVYSLKGDKENALKNLSRAVDLDAKCKEDAKKEEDFKKFRDDEDFKMIVS